MKGGAGFKILVLLQIGFVILENSPRFGSSAGTR